MEAKHVNEFRPNDVMWEKTSKGLLRNPDRLLKNTDKRMSQVPSPTQCDSRSFEPHDQMLYHRTILEPHTAYPIPAVTHYIVLTVQKTAFGLGIIPESLLPQLIQKGFHVEISGKMKKFNQTPYKLPPPTPIHVPA
ncbi:uncharacterized protein TNCV_1640541 [Trichonephila clavipes]|nr:uncharacterized protein TNCV_1640541 [Trichonephila clavipes]